MGKLGFRAQGQPTFSKTIDYPKFQDCIKMSLGAFRSRVNMRAMECVPSQTAQIWGLPTLQNRGLDVNSHYCGDASTATMHAGAQHTAWYAMLGPCWPS